MAKTEQVLLLVKLGFNRCLLSPSIGKHVSLLYLILRTQSTPALCNEDDESCSAMNFDKDIHAIVSFSTDKR